MRILIRFLFHFTRAITNGETWAFWVLAAIALSAVAWGFISFVRRPLGGDPDRTPLDDDRLRDDKNPYRQDI